jgi:outer membrane usher protein
MPRSILFLLFISLTASAENTKVWVLVNNVYKGRITLDFQQGYPCLRSTLFEEWGVDEQTLSTLTWNNKGCLTSDQLKLNAISYFYNNDANVVTILIPQFLIHPTRNGISTSRWDNGINAAFVNYNLKYDWNENNESRYGEKHSQAYLDLNSGINLNAWRMRYQNTILRDNNGYQKSYTRNAYVFRNITPIRSKLLIGNGQTQSALFDVISFRGITLHTDESMLPDSWRSFSPRIKGYAKSNAEITIRQNGTVIYQTRVSPGPYTLQDIYPPSSSGSLDMTVKESDGSETYRVIPYVTVPNMVKTGHLNYEITAGHYRVWRGSDSPEPSFTQMGLAQALPFGVTAYGGIIDSQLYKSYVVGAGKELGALGALSLDYTYAEAAQPRRNTLDRGKMYRLRYAKAFVDTKTTLSLETRYYPGNQHYRSFSDTVEQQKTWWWDWEDGVWQGEEDPEKRFRWEVNLNQDLWDNASLYASFIQENYRQPGDRQTTLLIGYTDTIKDIDYDLYFGYYHYPDEKSEQELNLSVSVPLSFFNRRLPRAIKLNYDKIMSNSVADSHTVSLSGSALADYSLNYRLGLYNDDDKGDIVNANVGYRYNAGQINLNASFGRDIREYGVNVSGSVLLHKHGLTLGQTLGETAALAETTGTPNISIDNQFGVTTDRRGYSLISYLTPYRVNRITVNNYNLPEGVDIPFYEIEVVPTYGAIAFARFMPVKRVDY